MNGGGTSSMPDEPILVKYHSTTKLPIPNIRQINRKIIVVLSHLMRCSSFLLPNGMRYQEFCKEEGCIHLGSF